MDLALWDMAVWYRDDPFNIRGEIAPERHNDTSFTGQHSRTTWVSHTQNVKPFWVWLQQDMTYEKMLTAGTLKTWNSLPEYVCIIQLLVTTSFNATCMEGHAVNWCHKSVEGRLATGYGGQFHFSGRPHNPTSQFWSSQTSVVTAESFSDRPGPL